MSEYAEVTQDEFTRIGGERPNYLAIESVLMKMGGGGLEGSKFKAEMLKAAGWKYEKMTSGRSVRSSFAACHTRFR